MRSKILSDFTRKFAKFRDKDLELYHQVKYPHALVEAIVDLDEVVGVNDLKQSVVRMIMVYMVEKLRGRLDYGNNNIIITGPPGVGKTTISKILAKIVNAIGIHHPDALKEIKESGEAPQTCNASGSSVPPKEPVDAFGLHKSRHISIASVVPSADNQSKVGKTTVQLRNRLALYRNHFQVVSDSMVILETNLKESIDYMKRYTKTNDEADLREVQRRLMEGHRYSIGIIKNVNTFETLGTTPGIPGIPGIPGSYPPSVREPKTGGSSSSPRESEEIPAHKSIEYWGNIVVEPEFNNIIIHGSRANMVAGFVGCTAKTTAEMIKKARGGVLFIDEAYQLVSMDTTSGPKNDFGPEVLVEINDNITRFPGNVIYIFAGYKDKILSNILKVQEGLDRRFTWKFDIESYTADELADIFRIDVGKTGWPLDSSLNLNEFFNKKYTDFPNYGGDCKNLAYFCRLFMTEKYLDTIYDNISDTEDKEDKEPETSESRTDSRTPESPESKHSSITLEILEESLKLVVKNRGVVIKKEDGAHLSMYL